MDTKVADTTGVPSPDPPGPDNNGTPPRNLSGNDQGGTQFDSVEPLFLGLDETHVIAVGAAIGGALIVLLIIVLILRKCKKSKKNVDLDFDELDGYGTQSRSAPISRSNSPTRWEKKASISSHSSGNSPRCSRTTGKKKPPLIRSVTVDTVPDFTLPIERVQPVSSTDRKYSAGQCTALQYQHSVLGALGAVQPDLYRSVDDEDPDVPPSVCGRIWFSVLYDVVVEQLSITLVKVKHLKGRGKTNAPRDPFVKIYLLPDESSCQQSKVRKKTLTPKFNETFTFQVPHTEIGSRTLRMSVYDVDKRRVRHSLGHVLIPISDLDITKGDMLWRDLEPVSQASTSLGELNFALTYTPNTDRLKVAILRARNLRKLEYDAEEEVFVRVQLLHGRKVHKTKKTASQKGTCEPVYNEVFTFPMSGKQMESCCIVVTLMTSVNTRLGSHDEEYGKVVVGPFMFARGEELLHWQEMLAQPRSAVARWHLLTNTPAPSDATSS